MVEQWRKQVVDLAKGFLHFRSGFTDINTKGATEVVPQRRQHKCHLHPFLTLVMNMFNESEGDADIDFFW